MQRIATVDVDADLFGTGKDGFTEGNPSTGVAATQTSDTWLNNVQEAICRSIELTDETELDASIYIQLAAAIAFVGRTTAYSNVSEQTSTKTSVELAAVAHDGYGLFVAVGPTDGADAYILTSPDGVTWTERSNPKNFALLSIAHNGLAPGSGGLWVAVGAADGTDPYIVSSPDGTTWTERAMTAPKNFRLESVVWDSTNSLWVAVGQADGGDALIVTTPDPTTTSWTERSNPKNFNLACVASDGAGNLLAAGSADGTDAYMVQSSNGTTWTEVSNPKNFALLGCAWATHLQKWVLTGSADGTDAYAIVGIPGDWEEATNPENLDLDHVAYDGMGTLVAVGEDGATYGSYLVISHNGKNWKPIENEGVSQEVLTGVVFDPILGSLVVVGGDSTLGDDAFILRSLPASPLDAFTP